MRLPSLLANRVLLVDRCALEMASSVESIEDKQLKLKTADGVKEMPNDAVYALIGREAPLDFFRRSGVPINGENTTKGWIAFAFFFVFVALVYDWKADGFLSSYWDASSFPSEMPSMISSMGDWFAAKVADRSSIIGVLAVSMKTAPFYYTMVYTTLIGVFGIRRIRRRKTPYVKVQTLTLFSVQFIPLFLLPELILPLLGYNGFFESGMGASLADNLFPSYISESAALAKDWPELNHPACLLESLWFYLSLAAHGL